MELLQKKVKFDEEKKQDNCDKKILLPKDRHPQNADHYKEEWSFIEYAPARENIAYHLQYLEYMVHLYNDYQMYLTIESLHCKNMLIAIAGIMESALFDLLLQLSAKKSGVSFEEKEDFIYLINEGFRHGLLDGSMKNQLHELRKVRNFVHITSLEHKEYEAYTIEQVNNYLVLLDNFRERIKRKFRK
jgi:hypothetical protein